MAGPVRLANQIRIELADHKQRKKYEELIRDDCARCNPALPDLSEKTRGFSTGTRAKIDCMFDMSARIFRANIKPGSQRDMQR